MPFVMDQDVKPQNLKDNNALEANALSKKGAVQTNGAVKPPTNGPMPNGISTSQHGLPNGHSASGQALSGPQAAPSLAGEWRSGVTNKSMGTMFYRLSQSCFHDLNTTLDTMADEQLQNPGAQSNGAASNLRDTDEGSLKKKNAFMKFAFDQRDRFIKALVLSDWARNADDMARLIDVLVWQRRHEADQMSGVDNIGYIKRELGATKMPNPNIVGAMELLGTGKAPSKTPDLGYLPPKRLTAKQLLRTLQDMNVILATRLNLHEDLPEHFRDFSIANGRATFRVPGKFEVDLSVADEDTTTSFYFIDFRFLFKPAPSALDERIRFEMEAGTNIQLGDKGLQGCFDFLHNFVLTHKINVLRDQFRQLLQEKWFDCARGENRGRVFTIQYWVGRKGRKSWLEFGVNTGKQQKSRSGKPPTAGLSVRWFRDGTLVQDPALAIDWASIDLEQIMSGIMARHVSWTLQSAKERLETNGTPAAGSRRNSKLETRLSTSNTRPEDCALQLSLPSSQSSLTLQVEPISGRFSITPATKRSADVERRLNNDPEALGSLPIAVSSLLCKLAQERVDKARQLVGWLPVANTFRYDNLKAKLEEHQGFKAYVCNKAWGNQWILCATFSLSGDKWWIAHVGERPVQRGVAPMKEVTKAFQLSVGDLLATKSAISRSSLLRIEQLAVAEVSFAVMSQQLSSMNIQYRIEKTLALTCEEDRVSGPTIGLFFRGSTVLKDSCGKSLAVDCIRLTHRGVRFEQSEGQEVAEMSHEIRLTVEGGKFKHLREYLSKQNREADIAMNETGALALRIRAPFGKAYIDQVVTRVQSCDRLDRYIAAMKKRSYKPTIVQLSKVAFTYDASQDLSVAISFAGKDGTLPARLELKPVGSNPQQRIRVMLEQLLNDRKKTDQLTVIGSILDYSLRAMQGFEKIESIDAGKRSATVSLRGPLHYMLEYKAPFPALKIDMDLRNTTNGDRKEVSWNIRSGKSKQELQKSAFGKAWLEFVGQKAALWSCPGDGSIIARPAGMKDLLLKLDELVRRFKPEDAIAKQDTADAVDAKPQTTPQQQPSAPQQKPQPPQQRPAAPQQKAAQQQRQQQQQQRLNQQKPAPPRPNQPAPTANMMPTPNNNNNRNNPPKPKKEIIELD